MTRLVLLAALLSACGTTASEQPLPESCSVQADYIRVQLCPQQPVAIVCTEEHPPNPLPGLCDGPDWTEGKQVTGNAWCCQ